MIILMVWIYRKTTNFIVQTMVMQSNNTLVPQNLKGTYDKPPNNTKISHKKVRVLQ